MTTDFETAARAEAERLTPEGTSVPVLRAERDNLVHMAEWARDYLAAQESTLPTAFRDPYALARFVVENEWALDSEINPSGRADWKETLGRVYDAWDGDTPEDIVSTIAAAVRLDRSFCAAAQEPTDAEVEVGIQADTDSLAAEIHEAVEFQYDQCDHGTYHGGHMHGRPYQMCRINAERIVRRRAARRDEEKR